MTSVDSEAPARPYFVHPAAIVETDAIGPRTRVWAFAHLLPGCRVGADCNICDGVFIEGGATVGDRVTVKCGVQLWEGVTLEDDVFVGPNATFTNDPFPRSRQHPAEYARTVVRRGVSIGANATILPGLVIGEGAMIGAGAVVTRDVPPGAVVVGNPGRIVRWIGNGEAHRARAVERTTTPTEAAALPALVVGGCRLVRLPMLRDARGLLSFGEHTAHLPFVPLRYFLIAGVPSGSLRGEHAHRELQQFLVCVHGGCRVVLEDGTHREQVLLDSPGVGVYIAPMTWTTILHDSPDTTVLVLASDTYREADYIRDYEEFRTLAAERGA